MLRLFVLIIAFAAACPQVSAAKSPYDPALTVNGDAITTWEIDQRAGFLKSIGLSGDLKAEARKALIDDRLKMAAAKAAGITVAEDELTQGIDEFVARGNVTPDQFRQILDRNGVDWETFRGVMRVSLAWRDLVRSKFSSQVQVGDDEVDRALTLTDEGGLRVLLSEIVVPVSGQDTATSISFLKDLKGSLHSTGDFAKAARRYSASATRADGGKMDWIDLNKLPGGLQATILGMTPGEITDPVELKNTVAIFQLRALSEAPAALPKVASLDYMLVRLPATDKGLARANRIAQGADQCSDIYGQTDDLPDSDVTRLTQAPDKIAPAVRKVLANLDPGESSTRLRSPDGSQAWLVMLCSRSPVIPQGETRAQILTKLRNQRLQALAGNYLDELRSAATVVTQ